MPRGGDPSMDVLVLIDKLDDLVHNAKPVPLTDQVRVDKEEIYDIVDQMRATIPEEIKQARWIGIRCAWTRKRSTTSSTRCARRSLRRSSRPAGSGSGARGQGRDLRHPRPDARDDP